MSKQLKDEAMNQIEIYKYIEGLPKDRQLALFHRALTVGHNVEGIGLILRNINLLF